MSYSDRAPHVEVRRQLVEEHRLDAVVSLPPGTFLPYTGISTAVLFFTKQIPARGMSGSTTPSATFGGTGSPTIAVAVVGLGSVEVVGPGTSAAPASELPSDPADIADLSGLPSAVSGELVDRFLTLITTLQVLLGAWRF